LQALGIPDELLNVMTTGETKRIGSIAILACSSKPPLGVPEEGIPIPDVEHLGYGIEMGSVRVYVSGDLIYSFSQHEELLAPVRQFKPDIGLLTTHPTEGEFPDFAGCVEMAVKLGLKAAVPAHYGCFVKRTFDPVMWASGFPPNGPRPIIIPYNTSIIYPT
jgi:L-ascorbate metabolism protein UlaG (beta-lactamase superfamily)